MMKLYSSKISSFYHFVLLILISNKTYQLGETRFLLFLSISMQKQIRIYIRVLIELLTIIRTTISQDEITLSWRPKKRS